MTTLLASDGVAPGREKTNMHTRAMLYLTPNDLLMTWPCAACEIDADKNPFSLGRGHFGVGAVVSKVNYKWMMEDGNLTPRYMQ